jgi:hypothetical protein
MGADSMCQGVASSSARLARRAICWKPTDTSSDLVVVVISRDEIEGRVASSTPGVLNSVLSTPQGALSLFEKVDVAFHGYDDDPRELFEIPEVRNFVAWLDDKFPFWLFFLTKRGRGLLCIMLCFMPPHLTEAARKTVHPQRIEELLSKRWFPAMNQMCNYVGFSEEENESLTENVVDYFCNGPAIDRR